VNVLIVTPFPVLPMTHGGRVRTFRLAAGLANAGAAVHVLCPWTPSLPLGSFTRDGVTVHPHRLLASILPPLLGDHILSTQVALSWQPRAIGPRRLLARFRTFDIVEFDYVAQAPWVRLLSPAQVVVYSAHNVEADYVRRGPLATSLNGYSLKRIEALERALVHRADLVVACTRADAISLTQLYDGGSQSLVVPNGFDDSLLSHDRDARRQGARAKLGLLPDELAILFVGGPAHHNLEAASYLARRVLPSLNRPARLIVVGACTRAVRSLPGVLRLGWVDDLGVPLAAADVAANPVSSGSGSNLKMPEYLAAGVPVVTTRFGLRGFEDFAEQVVVAEPAEFSQALASAHERPRAPVEKLRSLTWTALGKRLFAAYATVAGAGRDDRAG
jgi:glycosyltransferase involved in cell wall biosynthesis